MNKQAKSRNRRNAIYGRVRKLRQKQKENWTNERHEQILKLEKGVI